VHAVLSLYAQQCPGIGNLNLLHAAFICDVCHESASSWSPLIEHDSVATLGAVACSEGKV